MLTMDNGTIFYHLVSANFLRLLLNVWKIKLLTGIFRRYYTALPAFSRITDLMNQETKTK